MNSTIILREPPCKKPWRNNSPVCCFGQNIARCKNTCHKCTAPKASLTLWKWIPSYCSSQPVKWIDIIWFSVKSVVRVFQVQRGPAVSSTIRGARHYSFIQRDKLHTKVFFVVSSVFYTRPPRLPQVRAFKLKPMRVFYNHSNVHPRRTSYQRNHNV